MKVGDKVKAVVSGRVGTIMKSVSKTSTFSLKNDSVFVSGLGVILKKDLILLSEDDVDVEANEARIASLTAKLRDSLEAS